MGVYGGLWGCLFGVLWCLCFYILGHIYRKFSILFFLLGIRVIYCDSLSPNPYENSNPTKDRQYSPLGVPVVG